MAKCPHCGSPKFRYELRSAGTSSKSRYYHTGFDDNLIIPTGVKQRKSQTRHKSVGICPDCGYVEEKKNKGCLFYVLCFLVVAVVCSMLADRAHVNDQSGENTAATTANCYTDENLVLDYFDAESFEAALNAGVNMSGKTVQFTVSAFAPNSYFGYNMQTGVHLNFCSDSDPGASDGDTVILRVTEVSTVLGSYIIRYDNESILVKKD